MFEQLDEFMVEVQTSAGDSGFNVIEERIRLLLQPKPWWWPQWFYDRIVRRLIAIDHVHPIRHR